MEFDAFVVASQRLYTATSTGLDWGQRQFTRQSKRHSLERGKLTNYLNHDSSVHHTKQAVAARLGDGHCIGIVLI